MQGLKKAELFPLQPPPAGCYTLAGGVLRFCFPLTLEVSAPAAAAE